MSQEEASLHLPKAILLIEDSPGDAELALHALAEYKLASKVLHLHDGAQALDYLFRRGEFASRAEGNPALVLLDLKMPKVDGLQVLRQIKAEPTLSMIPIVVLTSSREKRDVEDAYRLGVNAYVVKPTHFIKFIDAVKQVGAFWANLNEPPPVSTSVAHEHTV
ncbi:MAG: response regulator [Rhodoferax sp.]|nr:response regulator [Rhodoferax sp.]